MHHRCSDYHVSRLLYDTLNKSGLRLSDFVVKTGYTNTAKGCKRFDEWLMNGDGHEFLIKGMLKEFPELIDSYQEARVQDDRRRKLEAIDRKQQLERLKYECFKPFIYADTNINSPIEIGSSIVLLGMLAKQIKQFFLEEKMTLRDAQEKARRHFIEYNGQLPHFGVINFYRFIDQYDHYFLLSITGEVTGEKSEVFKSIGDVYFR